MHILVLMNLHSDGMLLFWCPVIVPMPVHVLLRCVMMCVCSDAYFRHDGRSYYIAWLGYDACSGSGGML